MSASAKLLWPAGGNGLIPQPDFQSNPTENGGWEATQSFLVKKSTLSTTGLLFTRGKSVCDLDPNCPQNYRFLGLKKTDQSDHQPGVLNIHCTFTGYDQVGSNGSSGEEATTPTYSLRKDTEEIPLNEHRKWAAMSDASKARLGVIMSGTSAAVFNIAEGAYGYFDDNGDVFTELAGGFWATPSGSELDYARMIAQGRMTCKRPAWTYTVRTEGSSGFTSAQLNSAGKIVANPQGNPPTPSSSYCWFFVGPDQEQSGDKRFVKDLTYQLIPDTDENRFLYT
jgi:hypothetical protein